MDIQLQQHDDTHVGLTITLTPADYEPKVNAALKKYGRTAQMKGFRPGKVPPALLRKLYGKGLMAEEINSLLSQTLDDYIRTQELPVVGGPIADEASPAIDWENDREFSFRFRLGLHTPISLDVAGLQTTRYEVSPAADAVDKLIEQYQERLGRYVPLEAGTEDAVITGIAVPVEPAPAASPAEATPEAAADPDVEEAQEIADEDSQQDQAHGQVALHLKEMVRPEFYHLFAGCRVGDTLTFNMEEITLDDKHPRVEDDSLAFQDRPFLQEVTFRIEEVEQFEPAALDQTFFDKVVGQGKVTDEAGLRAEVAERMRQNLREQAEEFTLYQIRQELTRGLTFEVPQDFLREWLLERNEELTPERLDEQFDDILKGIKWSIYTDRYARTHEVKVTSEDVQAAAVETVGRQFGQMGMPAQGELFDYYLQKYLEKEENRRELYEMALTRQVLQHVAGRVELPTEQIDSETFRQITKAATEAQEA